MARSPFWIMGCAMLTLSGCAMFSSPPRQAELVKVGHWEGRISLKVLRDPPELFSASFEINGRPEDGELTFFSPIGTTLAVARWTPFNAQLMEGAKVKRYDSVEAMMLELTGSKLPLPELLGWLDQDGAELPGWTLKSDNSSSSRRVFAKRQQPLPAVELTLVIDPKR